MPSHSVTHFYMHGLALLHLFVFNFPTCIFALSCLRGFTRLVCVNIIVVCKLLMNEFRATGKSERIGEWKQEKNRFVKINKVELWRIPRHSVDPIINHWIIWNDSNSVYDCNPFDDDDDGFRCVSVCTHTPKTYSVDTYARSFIFLRMV